MVPRMPLLYLLVVLACVTLSYGDACTHPVYCTGPLLHAVQMAQIFNDSKTFVDMPMKYPPDQILALFNKRLSNTSTQHEIKAFVEEYFYPAGSDLVDVEPTDWVHNPTFIAQLNTSEMKAFGKGIHQKWKTLVRQWNNSFCDGCFSHLVVDRPFVIAGSRFREFYYWDTYWTMQGLLVSGMLNTTKGVLLNFLELVKEIGFLPNGGRIYYLNRSQPPMLTQMVERYYAVTADIEFLEQALPILDMEYQYWMSNTTVEPEPGFVLNRYYVVNNAPRPESYWEDVTLASTLPAEEREDLYQQLSTGAETGWDFSSRWMDNEPNLSSLITNQIIPVDLNSILYKNEIVMSGFYKLVKQPVQQQLYQQRAQKRLAAIQALLWNNETGIWNDRYLNGTFDTRYYGSIWYPFWAGAFGDLSSNQIEAIINNLTDILSYPGGVPVSILQTGQQWDFPNGWAPLQYLAISGLTTIANTNGLDQSLRTQCAEIAGQIVSRWLTSNYCAWNVTGDLYEKYDVTTRGIPGGGGEYTVQTGFGWTNGVALHLLQLYGNTFSLEACGQGEWVPYLPERMRKE